MSIDNDLAGKLGLTKRLLPARSVRKLNKQHMLHNDNDSARYMLR